SQRTNRGIIRLRAGFIVSQRTNRVIFRLRAGFICSQRTNRGIFRLRAGFIVSQVDLVPEPAKKSPEEYMIDTVTVTSIKSYYIHSRVKGMSHSPFDMRASLRQGHFVMFDANTGSQSNDQNAVLVPFHSLDSLFHHLRI